MFASSFALCPMLMLYGQDAYFINKIWAPRPVITTGGYDRESGLKVAEETGQIVGYGRAFLSNVSPALNFKLQQPGTEIHLRRMQPDLPFRLKNNVKLNDPEYDTFYLPQSEKGYITYPFSEEFLKATGKA